MTNGGRGVTHGERRGVGECVSFQGRGNCVVGFWHVGNIRFGGWRERDGGRHSGDLGVVASPPQGLV